MVGSKRFIGQHQYLMCMQVKFQERTFTFKVETGSSTDRDSWVAALKLCKQQQLEDHSLEHETADKLDHLRKVSWPSAATQRGCC